MERANPPTIPRVLTVAEVAEALRCSRRTVYNMVAAGELPALHYGRSVRVPEPVLAAWIAARVRAAPPGPESDVGER